MQEEEVEEEEEKKEKKKEKKEKKKKEEDRRKRRIGGREGRGGRVTVSGEVQRYILPIQDHFFCGCPPP